MSIQTLTQEQKDKMLTTFNAYWQQQILKPNVGQEFIPAIRMLDTYDHGNKLRVVLQLENDKVRLMMMTKESE